MSTLERTQIEAERTLRRQIREHARGQEGYDARLYDLWEEWNVRFFEGLLVPPLVQLAEPGQTHNYGDCSNYSGLAGIRSRIRLRPSILGGTLRDLRDGSRNPKGLRRFLEDVLLHEMIHEFQQEITGERDDSWSGHGPAFSAKANEIGQKLGLPPVRRTCKSRDGKEPSPSQWPHDVRPDGYYLGAHVLARKDKPKKVTVPIDDVGLAAAVLGKHFDRDELLRRWPTQVINIGHGETYDIYIGRGMRGTGLKKSEWHNPFLMDLPDKKRDGTREEVIEKFDRYLDGPVENYEGKVFDGRHLIADLHEIAGKTLGCHCSPQACHGDVLARRAEVERMLGEDTQS